MTLEATAKGLGDVGTLDANLQLIACAGAGKTQRVAERVMAQLELPEVEPENVVAFTFNERAAAELKDRIARIHEARHGTREGLADLYVGTIHGYCLDLLQRHSFEALAFNVLDDVQQRLLITRGCKKVGLTEVLGWRQYRDAKAFAEMMAILREGDVDLEKLEGTDAGECLSRYCKRLNETKYLDFTAIMDEAVAHLEDDAEFRKRVAGQVQFLTVDEYQDVNPLQERLIRALADLGASITVVGDDDQLLYGWRGSSASNIRRFAERYDDVDFERMELNYRSSRGVVDLAREVIAHNDPDRLPKAMVSAGNQAYEEGDVAMESFGGPQDEAAYIASRIEDLLGTPFKDAPDEPERGLAFNDMAILVRVKKLIPDIVAALEEHEIPYVVAGVSSLFDSAEAQAARELFHFLAGRSGADDLRAAWAAARLGATDDDLARAVAVAVDDRRDIEDGSGRFGVYNLQRSYLRFLEALEIREEKIVGASPAHGHERSEVVYYNLGKFSQVLSDYEQIYFKSEPGWKYESFCRFLQNQAESIYPEGWVEAKYLTPNAVQILTIHQAKGLQWPVVFVPGLTKGRFPSKGGGGRSPWSVIPPGAVRNQADYAGGEHDERNLFYVACTRAKKYLALTRAVYPTEKRAWSTPSPFWEEASDALASIDPPDSAPERREKLEPTPRNGLEDVLLSFSELRYAYECPYSFKLRFLYGYNPPLAEALGYGKGLHDALFELHDRAMRGNGDTSKDAVDDLVDTHLNLRFAYPSLEEQLTDSAKRRLTAYIDARGARFDDIEHAEQPVEIELGNGVLVNGRIDLIRRRSTNEVVVIDFKSNDRTQQEEVTDLQLRLYALGYRQATGETPANVVVENLDDLENPKVDAVTEEMLDDAAGVVLVAAKRMRTNDFERRPAGADDEARDATCKRCDLAMLCGTWRYSG